MDSILLAENINLSKVKYGAVKLLPSGGKSIYMSHDNTAFIVQTPEMRSPFGLSKWDKTEKGSDGTEKNSFKYDLLLGFDGRETRESLNTFYQKLEELDNKLVEDGMENSMNWLGKKMTSKEVTQELYTPMVRHSRDKNTGEINDKYAPTFKLTVPFKDGKFQCEVYGPNNKEIDLSTVNVQGARVIAIIQCVGIWVVGKKYGCSWKVLQMKITPRSNIPKFAFREIANDKVKDDDGDDEEELVEEEEIVDSSEDELEHPKSVGSKKK